MSLRVLFLGFSGALVMFGVVLLFIGVAGDLVPWLPLLIAGAAGSVLAARFVVKPLDCTSSTTLAVSYRTRFFLAIACSETVALFGFVFSFIGGPVWIYHLAAAFSLYRFWTVAPPTRAGIARDQERLDASGCALSLVAALRGSPPAASPPPPPPQPPVPPYPPPFPPPHDG